MKPSLVALRAAMAGTTLLLAAPAIPISALDLSALPGGIYTMQLLTPTGMVTRHLTH